MIFLSFLTALILQSSYSNTMIIDGYTDKLSAFPGDSLSLYFNASEINNRFRANLYNMKGEVVKSIEIAVKPQPSIGAKAYEIGYGYSRSARIVVPELKSGVYLWENKVPFIIKARNAKIIVVYPSNTENAYNCTGGKSLYGFNSSEGKGATKVSFMRPQGVERFSEAFLRWSAKENIPDISYITDADMDDYAEIKKASLLIITGHSEYWTLKARKGFDRFIASGKNAMVLSGNTMWWQVRYNKNHDQLICYRKSVDDKIDVLKLKTINWNDSTLEYSILRSLGTDSSFGGFGNKMDKGWDGYKLIASSPLLEGTGLKKGDTLRLLTREADGAPISTFSRGIPVLNEAALQFYRSEIIGFDLVSRTNGDGVLTWLVFKPAKTSGVVINVASTNWCAQNGIGSSAEIQTITKTMIRKLLNKENVFSVDDVIVFKDILN